MLQIFSWLILKLTSALGFPPPLYLFKFPNKILVCKYGVFIYTLHTLFFIYEWFSADVHYNYIWFWRYNNNKWYIKMYIYETI